MAVSLSELNAELNTLLRPELFKDYCPNGLQVEGRKQITKLVTGVTASQALIDAACEAEADAIIVHHGYFWQGEDQRVTGSKRKRLKKLLENDVSLYAFHLPLDVHEQFGNNIELAKLLGITVEGELKKISNQALVLTGSISQSQTFNSMVDLLTEKLSRAPQAIEGSSAEIKSIAWCTGAAQNYIDLAIDSGVDAYLTGEISEQTYHAAKESGIHFFGAGHHATERYGVQALGRHLAEKFSLEHCFIDIDNPV